MNTNYDPKEIDQLIKTLPQPLLDALLSEESANTIKRICQRNEITEEGCSFVAEITGYVLSGLLNPNELKNRLSGRISEEKAKRVAQEITRFILFPVKEELAKFYQGIEITPGGGLLEKGMPSQESSQVGERITEEEALPEDREANPPQEDPYRESID